MIARVSAVEQRRALLSLLLILALAAALRFGRGDVVEYFHDDAMLATLALELADGLRFPLTGILSSTGIPNSPVSVYSLAIPFTLSSDPAFVIHSVMLWNVIGVAILWLIARRYCGSRIALITGLLYAVNPWAVLFSRKIWAQELHTPIILFGLLLLLYGYWESHEGWRRKRCVYLAQALSMPILLIGFQFHFASLPLLLLIPIVLWLGRERVIVGAFFAGIALSLIVILPYGIGLTQTLAMDPARISDAFDRSMERAAVFSPASLNAIARLATGSGLEHWLAPDQARELALEYSPLQHFNLALLALLFIGIAAVYRHSRALALLLLIWALLPGLLLTFEWTPVYVHYFIPSIPALALICGYGGDWMLRLSAQRRQLQIAVWLGFALLLALLARSWIVSMNYVAEKHVEYPGFTTPMSKLSPLRERLSAFDDVVIVAGGMSWNLHHEVAVWDTLLWDAATCVRTIIPEGFAVFPARPFAAVIAPSAPSGSFTELYRNESPAFFETREGDADYTLYQWVNAPSWSGAAISSIEPELFENGVHLIGYALTDEHVILEWQLPAQQIGADYQFSAQLFDADGERLSQLDATFWHGRHWCDGDRLLTWGALDAHASATLLKVALYQLAGEKNSVRFTNLNLVDGLGNPKGQSVDIALEQRDV